ncbi:hypothetical protein [Tritonibacter mobilis]|uniref:hypothetical protein n=1 Tax=Tritonibacter mobilis TaxID=379347 RepID=UPI000806EA1D|nr:hypothetical protein [Tritonibacter mobilis]
MSVHADPAAHGHRFGAVVVTVDMQAGDCVIRAPQPCKGPVSVVERKARFNTLDEIYAAHRTQNWLSRKPQQHPHAGDMASALKFAGQLLNAEQERKRRA